MVFDRLALTFAAFPLVGAFSRLLLGLWSGLLELVLMRLADACVNDAILRRSRQSWIFRT